MRSKVSRPQTEGGCRFAAIGIRQPVPKARSVIFSPGGACRRLNSARRTNRTTCLTVSRSNPTATISSGDWW